LFTRLIGTPYGDDVAVEPGIVNGSPGACASVGAGSNADSARRSFNMRAVTSRTARRSLDRRRSVQETAR
jgi:hypothetical protein